MQSNRQSLRYSESCSPSNDVTTVLAHRQPCCSFTATMSSTPSLVFLLDQHLNCSQISIRSCGKGSEFMNSFSSLNILIYNKVCAGEHKERSITRMKWEDTQWQLLNSLYFSISFMIICFSPFPLLLSSSLHSEFHFILIPNSMFYWPHIKYIVQLIMARLELLSKFDKQAENRTLVFKEGFLLFHSNPKTHQRHRQLATDFKILLKMFYQFTLLDIFITIYICKVVM